MLLRLLKLSSIAILNIHLRLIQPDGPGRHRNAITHPPWSMCSWSTDRDIYFFSLNRSICMYRHRLFIYYIFSTCICIHTCVWLCMWVYMYKNHHSFGIKIILKWRYLKPYLHFPYLMKAEPSEKYSCHQLPSKRVSCAFQEGGRPPIPISIKKKPNRTFHTFSPKP